MRRTGGGSLTYTRTACRAAPRQARRDTRVTPKAPEGTRRYPKVPEATRSTRKYGKVLEHAGIRRERRWHSALQSHLQREPVQCAVRSSAVAGYGRKGETRQDEPAISLHSSSNTLQPNATGTSIKRQAGYIAESEKRSP